MTSCGPSSTNERKSSRSSGDSARGSISEYAYARRRFFGFSVFVLPSEAAAAPHLHLLQIQVVHRGYVERQQLRDDESANHSEAERLTRLRARAVAESDRQRTHQRGHRGHHDGAEANQCAVVDGLLCALSGALRIQRKVDHHDRIL